MSKIGLFKSLLKRKIEEYAVDVGLHADKVGIYAGDEDNFIHIAAAIATTYIRRSIATTTGNVIFKNEKLKYTQSM